VRLGSYIVGTFILCSAGACLIPYRVSNPKVIAGYKADDASTSIIKPGITTKAEVLQKLGKPKLDMTEARLIAYNWIQGDYHLFLIFPGESGLNARDVELGSSYFFFVAFDHEDRVLVSGLKKRLGTGTTSIQDLAQEWAEQQGLVVSLAPQKAFVAEAPTGQALLYVYFADGPPARPEVLVDQNLKGEIDKQTYICVALSRGTHLVTVAPFPNEPALHPVSISLNLTSNVKYFVSYNLPWTWGHQGMTLQSEQTAAPVLAQMKPGAR
jgi:hypothetical protein